MKTDENGCVLLSDFDFEKRISIIIGKESITNDVEDVFTVDSDFIRENVIYTLNGYKRDNKELSSLFVDAVSKCYDTPISSDTILSCVTADKVVKRDIAQVFGVLLGVYVAIRSGYSRIFIDNIDAFLHPQEQRDILNIAISFAEDVKQKMITSSSS